MAEEFKIKSNSGNVSHHSVQNLLSFRVLSNNIKIKIWAYRITVLLVLCACETASCIEGKKKNRLRLPESLVLRKLFGP